MKTENQIPDLKDAEELALEKGMTVKKYRNGINIKENGKTVSNVFERKYGLSWQVKDGYDRIVTFAQLKSKFDSDIWKIDIKQKTEDKVEIPKSDSPLIPKMFVYIPRKIETGNFDIDEFEIAMKESKNVLLEGPTGSGKSSLVRYYCAKNKLPYKRISLNGGATVEDLVGHYILKKGETQWVDGILTVAVRNGWVLVIDEINAASPEILFILNSLLDDERILILSSKDGETIVPHSNFRCIATMNPTEQGYAGTSEVNEALRDRFHLTLYIDYNESVEKKILKSMGLEEESYSKIMDLTKKLREAYAKSEIITPFSTRSVINFAELSLVKKEKLIINRFRNSDKAAVSDLLDIFIYKSDNIENKDDSQNTENIQY